MKFTSALIVSSALPLLLLCHCADPGEFEGSNEGSQVANPNTKVRPAPPASVDPKKPATDVPTTPKVEPAKTPKVEPAATKTTCPGGVTAPWGDGRIQYSNIVLEDKVGAVEITGLKASGVAEDWIVQGGLTRGTGLDGNRYTGLQGRLTVTFVDDSRGEVTIEHIGTGASPPVVNVTVKCQAAVAK